MKILAKWQNVNYLILNWIAGDFDDFRSLIANRSRISSLQILKIYLIEMIIFNALKNQLNFLKY